MSIFILKNPTNQSVVITYYMYYMKSTLSLYIRSTTEYWLIDVWRKRKMRITYTCIYLITRDGNFKPINWFVRPSDCDRLQNHDTVSCLYFKNVYFAIALQHCETLISDPFTWHGMWSWDSLGYEIKIVNPKENW